MRATARRGAERRHQVRGPSDREKWRVALPERLAPYGDDWWFQSALAIMLGMDRYEDRGASRSARSSSTRCVRPTS